MSGERLATGPHSYQLQLRCLRLACASVRFREVFADLAEQLSVVLAVFVGSAGQVSGEFKLLHCLRVLAPFQIYVTQGIEDGGIAWR